MGLLDSLRRILGLTPQQPPLPPPPPQASPPPAPPPAQESFMRAAPPVPTRGEPARPDPNEPKPVHSVSDRRPGRHGTAPLVAPPDISRAAEAPKDTRKQAEEYLDRLQSKISQLADDFAEGVINREQFQRLYEHYQRERRGVENLLTTADAAPAALNTKVAANEGQSVVIRKQHIARAIGYSIYENLSGMPITTLGSFELDPALVIPMLSSFRSATQEIFGAGIRSSAIEGGRWVCFVPGELTTLLALFSNEPAQKQMTYLEDLHRLFEKANRRHLLQSPVTAAALLFPHEFYLKT